MRDESRHGDGGAVPPVSRAIDESALQTPNCPVCLHRMEPDETEEGRVYWRCPSCGQAKLA